jgi:probable phosphoglycerate mutase
MTQLFLIRHAESISIAGSASDIVPPDEESGLSDRGRAQASALGAHLERFAENARVISSPMRRARETSEILAKQLCAEVTLDVRLAERRFDYPPGTTGQESRRLQLDALLRQDIPMPFGETLAEHRSRVADWLSEFRSSAEDETRYFAVSHGGTIDHLQACFHDSPVSAMATMFTACEPARYHLWTRVEPIPGHRVWRLDGIDRGVDQG